MTPRLVRLAAYLLAVVSMGLGLLLMFASFLFLTQSQGDLLAGQAGFVAGSVAVTGGVIAFAILASSNPLPSDR